MKRLGVREFRDHATQYLAGDEVLAIERHGEPLGFYIPARSPRQVDREKALARLERTVEEVLAKTGMTEEELSSLFDLNVPVPDKPFGRRVPQEPHAPGR